MAESGHYTTGVAVVTGEARSVAAAPAMERARMSRIRIQPLGGGGVSRMLLALGLAVPIAVAAAGPGPQWVGDGVRFTLDQPQASRVYLAGSFNGWAGNTGGMVSNPAHAMSREDDGLWRKTESLRPYTYRYKYVVVDTEGGTQWIADPHGSSTDADGNSLLQVGALLPAGVAIPAPLAGRPLQVPLPPAGTLLPLRGALTVALTPIWVHPGEATTARIGVRLDGRASPPTLVVEARRYPAGAVVQRVVTAAVEHLDVALGPFADEGGYLVEARLLRDGACVDSARRVLTVAASIADDLRYGFYANWGAMGVDYDAKTELLAGLHVNAVEFYDYFPAHGRYAPTQEVYAFEPFGVHILGRDVREKLQAALRRGLMPVAYVAAYAASASVFAEHPYPMTDAAGRPRIYNRYVMPIDEARARGLDVWFYLMAIARDSPWHAHVLREFAAALDDGPGDLVAFRGIGIDSHGHQEDERYYSAGSADNGRLLTQVMRDFTEDVHALAHRIYPDALVTFNCVNELGIGEMAAVTDFLFMEIWAVHRRGLDELVDLCYGHRAAHRQRVILKLYPADMEPLRREWDPLALRRILGACMTGGGSLMVVGEPDERAGTLRAIANLYHPDNAELPPACEQVLRRYYFVDALLYRLTHGKNVRNLALAIALPGCQVRAFLAEPDELVIQLLRHGRDWEWTSPMRPLEVLRELEVAIPMPDGRRPLGVHYVTPDAEEWILPAPLDWEYRDGCVRTMLPLLDVHGTVLVTLAP